MPPVFGKSQPLAILLVFLAVTCVACRTSAPAMSINQKTDGRVRDKLKFQIEENGVYRITRQELSSAGLALGDLAIDNLRLSQAGQSVPSLIIDDSLVFYGMAPESRYVSERPYILETGKPGLEMAQSKVPEAEKVLTEKVSKTIHLEENHEYVSEARLEENDDVWFWYRLRQQDVFSVEVDLDFVETAEAVIRVSAWGFTFDREIEGDHSFDVLVNDVPVGSIEWDGQTFNTDEIEISSGLLKTGTNKITLDNRPEGASFLDIMLINWIELDYMSSAKAVDDQLIFSAQNSLVQLDQFSANPLILNISDPSDPEQIVNWRYDKGRLFLPLDKENKIVATGPNGFMSPRIEEFRTSNWRDEKQQSDLIIITTDELAPSLTPLIDAREEQGLNVSLVPVEEIYDEFGYGEPSPESISRFVTYAVEKWQEPAPRYLFLVGDATSDYLGYLGDIPVNIVPSIIVPVQFSGETVSDSRLADVDGDKKPDLAVGRWPVRTPEEAESLVERTLAYERGHASENIIFATDSSESRFKTMALELTNASNLPEDHIKIMEGSPAAEISAEINKGAWLATYIGHGSIGRWGKDGIFELAAVNDLAPEVPPIVLQFTCLTGLFSHPEELSLSEAMLAHPHGPVLTIAATSLTLSGHQEKFAIELLKQLQNPNQDRIGDAFQEAKLSLDVENSNGLREISDTFALFGDPSTIILRP